MTSMANHHQQRTTDSLQQQQLEQESPISLLPEGCIANIISRTNPRDACRLALVSKIFRSAAESDVVWERFLPADYQTIISKSSPWPPSSLLCLLSTSSLPGLPCMFPLLSLRSKKSLFLSLCKRPIFIDDGKKAFFLDKQSGKKCYMISSRDLMFVRGDIPTDWGWTSLPGATFLEFAELIHGFWLEIHGKISTRILSPGTNYTAYLVFKPKEMFYWFENQPVQVSVGLVGSKNHKRSVFLHERRGWRMQSSPSFGWRLPSCRIVFGGKFPKKRGDKWHEVELGDFFNAGDEDGELEISILEVRGGHWKSGLIVQGIEIRPKQGVQISDLLP